MSRIIPLADARTSTYTLGRGRLVVGLWLLASFLVVQNPFVRSSRIKCALLRAFGARIGRGVILREVRVHLPWRLTIGDNSWIGERVYLHNQAHVVIGSNCVISQEAFITTGTHDSRRNMDLVTRSVHIGSGTWITSRAMVLAGTHIPEGVIVTPGSVIHGKLVKPHWIYRGNPAAPVRPREYVGVDE